MSPVILVDATCPRCAGSGSAWDLDLQLFGDCPRCDGEGTIAVHHATCPCHTCDGERFAVTASEPEPDIGF